MDNTGNAYVSYSIQKLKEYLLGVIANLGTSGDGREVQIQATETYIQWKYDTDVSWTNLVALADLKGDTGETGATGATGAQGPAGPAGADAVISNTTITNNLYATYGDISELTVDRLLTLNKVEKYWAGDTDEVNYIKVQDQTYRAVTGTTDGSTTQLTDRDGNLLYYKGPVTAGTYKTVGMSTTPTAFPVMVYDYDELTKMTIGHVYDEDSGYYLPQIIMGAGSGAGDNGKGFIYKGLSGLYIDYYSATTGDLRRVALTDDGIVVTPMALESIDFYDNGFIAEYTNETVAMTWEKDGGGRIIKLITEDMIEIPVTWNAGDM